MLSSIWASRPPPSPHKSWSSNSYRPIYPSLSLLIPHLEFHYNGYMSGQFPSLLIRKCLSLGCDEDSAIQTHLQALWSVKDGSPVLFLHVCMHSTVVASNISLSQPHNLYWTEQVSVAQDAHRCFQVRAKVQFIRPNTCLQISQLSPNQSNRSPNRYYSVNELQQQADT
jgi:hypothetical protein